MQEMPNDGGVMSEVAACDRNLEGLSRLHSEEVWQRTEMRKQMYMNRKA